MPRGPPNTPRATPAKAICEPSGDQDGGSNHSGSGLVHSPPPASRSGRAPVSSTVANSGREEDTLGITTAKPGPLARGGPGTRRAALVPARLPAGSRPPFHAVDGGVVKRGQLLPTGPVGVDLRD